MRIHSAAVLFEEVFGQVGFDQLALERLFGVLDVEVADQLLGDRRGALDRLAAGQQVLPGGAGDAFGVERPVVEEVLVLDRDRGVLERLRQGRWRETGWRMLLERMKPIRLPSAA